MGKNLLPKKSPTQKFSHLEINVLHKIFQTPWWEENVLPKKFFTWISPRNVPTWKCFTEASRETLMGWKESGADPNSRSVGATREWRSVASQYFSTNIDPLPFSFISYICLARFWLFWGGNRNRYWRIKSYMQSAAVGHKFLHLM